MRWINMNMNAVIGALLLAVIVRPDPAVAAGVLDIDTGDTEIRIGNIMPYTGLLAAFAAIGRAEAAYFDMVNDKGGINGRKIKFISYDDSSSPATAIEQTRNLVETEKVLLMFGSFGTPSNLATRPYLNERKVPQLFVASGDREFANPKAFPWTMGWQPPFRIEGRIYANYIQAAYPERKIAVLWQDDQFGKDLFQGLQEGLGDSARLIVADTTFDSADLSSLGAQLSVLKNSGAEILLLDVAPAFAAQAIRKIAELDWHPAILLDNASASIASALRPAGLQNSSGVISTSFLKDTADPQWNNDQATKDFLSFMDKYYPDGDKDDVNAAFGYAVAETLFQVLSRCGDDLSRANIMQQSASLKAYRTAILLPGITIDTGPNDFRPIKQMRLVQFDGLAWQPIGDVIESAFVSDADDLKAKAK
jgi:branched-chain amino acid transport system substrate-binding protein